MDVLRSCIVCNQRHRDGHRYLVAARSVVGKGIFDDGIFLHDSVRIHIVKGAT